MQHRDGGEPLELDGSIFDEGLRISTIGVVDIFEIEMHSKLTFMFALMAHDGVLPE